MYAFISGIIEQKSEGILVLNCNGVGYELFVTADTLINVGDIGDFAKIYTYLHVREDAMVLYGFKSIQEKNIFLQLITVSGVGPKMAITILSNISSDKLVNAIANEDVKTLSAIKGLGKKTAERLIVDLKNAFDSTNIAISLDKTTNIDENIFDEAITLLTNMGLTKYEASTLVKKVYSENDTIEAIIQKALRNMV